MKRKHVMVLLSALTIALSMSISACGNGREGDDGSMMESMKSETSSGETGGGEAGTAETLQDSQSQQESEATEGAESPAPASADMEKEAAGSEVLEGTVESIDGNSFIINKTFTETLEDGSLLAYSSGEDKTLITVHFTESTSFIVCTVKNGGVNPSDAVNETASKDDLKTGASVTMKGTGSDTEFTASEIVIYHFI